MSIRLIEGSVWVWTIDLTSKSRRKSNWRRRRWEEIKEDCQTSWILQDRTRKLFSWEYGLFFKTREECLWKWFTDHQGMPPQFQKGSSLPCFQQKKGLCPELWGWGHPEPWGNNPCWVELLGQNLHLTGSRRLNPWPSGSGRQELYPSRPGI